MFKLENFSEMAESTSRVNSRNFVHGCQDADRARGQAAVEPNLPCSTFLRPMYLGMTSRAQSDHEVKLGYARNAMISPSLSRHTRGSGNHHDAVPVHAGLRSTLGPSAVACSRFTQPERNHILAPAWDQERAAPISSQSPHAQVDVAIDPTLFPRRCPLSSKAIP